MEDVTLLRIGIGGWEHEVLDRCLYQRPGMGSLEKLSFYAQFFGAVEVRPTFWDESLGAAEARDWASAVGADFRFVVKLHRTFTHAREMKSEPARSTRALLAELARRDRLGALLLQFPYSFTNTGAARYHLARLAEAFRGFPLQVEFRHDSWNQSGTGALLGEHDMTPAIVDMPRIRQLGPLASVRPDGTAYVRLHGRNEKGWLLPAMDLRYDYLYNARELAELKRRLDHLTARSESSIVIFNNTTGGKAVANALQLQAKLSASRKTALPPRSLEAFPFLREIAAPETGAMELFAEESYRKAI
jgi:uncharacterized protein YecE (DUF72 family)